MTIDKLADIKARWPRPAGLDRETAPRAVVDIYWLVDTVERLRRTAYLNAQMDLSELLAAARASERYHHDMDFHLLTDWVDRLNPQGESDGL